MDRVGLVNRRVWFNHRRSHPPNVGCFSRRRRGLVRLGIGTPIPIRGENYPVDGPRNVGVALGDDGYRRVARAIRGV